MDYEALCRYLESKPGARRDMPFGPEALVFKVLKKIFAIVAWQADPLTVSLKSDPMDAVILRKQYDAVRPGYHLNKKHWNTVILNDSVPELELLRMLDDSYDLVVEGMPWADREKLIEMGWHGSSKT